MEYVKTTWEDYPSTNSIINATKLNKIEDALEQVSEKNIITIGLESDTTINPATAYLDTKINLNNEMGSVGTRLVHENGAITIGDGISKIKVSAMAILRNSAQTTGIEIWKNDTMCYCNFITPNGTNFISCSIPDGILNVEENDVISLKIYTTTTTESRTVIAYSGYGTYLTVEAIE